MRTLREVRADLKGPVATLAALLRAEGRSRVEVEEAVARFFEITDERALRGLQRALRSIWITEDLREVLGDDPALMDEW